MMMMMILSLSLSSLTIIEFGPRPNYTSRSSLWPLTAMMMIIMIIMMIIPSHNDDDDDDDSLPLSLLSSLLPFIEFGSRPNYTSRTSLWPLTAIMMIILIIMMIIPSHNDDDDDSLSLSLLSNNY